MTFRFEIQIVAWACNSQHVLAITFLLCHRTTDTELVGLPITIRRSDFVVKCHFLWVLIIWSVVSCPTGLCVSDGFSFHRLPCFLGDAKVHMNQVMPAGFPSPIQPPPSIECGLYIYISAFMPSHFETNPYFAHYVEVMFFCYFICFVCFKWPIQTLTSFHFPSFCGFATIWPAELQAAVGVFLFLDTLSQRLNKIALDHKHNKPNKSNFFGGWDRCIGF